MDQRKIALLVYVALVVAAAFAIGYFAGAGSTAAQIEIHTMEVQTKPVSNLPEQQTEPEPAAAEPQYPLDLNTADRAELEWLPGIGPELADRIVTYRQTIGRFVCTEQIMDVEGIGEKRYAALEQLITVEVDP